MQRDRSWGLSALSRSALFVLVSSVVTLPLGACSSGEGVGRDAAGDDGGRSNDGAAKGGDGQDAGPGGGADGGSGGATGNDAAIADGAAGGPSVDGGVKDLVTRDGGSEDAAVEGAGGSADASPSSIVVMVTVPGTADLFGAGHSTVPPDPNAPGTEGTLPILVELPAGTGRTMTVTNVSGSVDIDGDGGLGATGADGFTYTAMPGTGPAIGGLTFPTSDRLFYLMGVFLGVAEPANPGPPSYVVNPTASTINGITLAQVFFIGDGLDGAIPGTGDVQMFRVPDGATRLFLAFGDLIFNDNVGAIAATVSVSR